MPRTARPLKPHEIEALVHGYKSGESIKELATEFGIDRRIASSYLHDANIPILRGVLSASDIDEVIRLYQARQSARQIAKQFGVNVKTVLRALRRQGVHIRPRYA